MDFTKYLKIHQIFSSGSNDQELALQALPDFYAGIEA
jgi:hypothetical protein